MDNIQVTHNNDNHHYRIAMDIAKEGSSLWDLTPYVKGRVGDNRFGLQVTWTYQGQLMNIEGMKPYIEGNVGQYSVDDKNNLQLDPNSGVVRYVGDPADCQAGGQATYYFPEQMFPKEGIFKGYIGLLDDRDDSKNPHISGVTVWFKVLPGIAEMGHACDYYISELDKALVDYKAKMTANEADYTKRVNDTLDTINQRNETETKNSHDAALAAQAEVDATRANNKKLADEIGSQQNYIAAHNIVTTDKFKDLSNDLTRQVTESFVQPEAYNSLDELKAAYSSGAKGIFVTLDNGHFYVWQNNDWKDCGAFQSAGIARSSIHLEQLSDSLQKGIYPDVTEINVGNINSGFISRWDGSVRSASDSMQPVHTDPINVRPGDEYYIYTNQYYDGKAVIFKNNDEIVSYLPIEMNANVVDFKFTVPRNANAIVINSVRSVMPRLFKVNSYYSMPNYTDSFLTLLKDQKYNFEDVSLDKYDKTGFWSRDSGQFKATEVDKTEAQISYQPVKVKPYEIYRIHGCTAYEANLYVIIDSSGQKIETWPDSDDVNTDLTNVFMIPKNGAYLEINEYALNVKTTLQKATAIKKTKILDDKKWAAVGDSWTAIFSDKSQSYTDDVANYTGINAVNCGIGGTGYFADNNSANQQFYTRSVPDDADVYTVFGSFNDAFITNFKFGTSGDTGTDTMWGAMLNTIDNIYKANPNAVIGLITPGPWGSINQFATDKMSTLDAHDDATVNDMAINDFAEKYVSTLKDFAKMYSLPFLDLYHESNLRPWNDDFINSYYHGQSPTDTTHPNPDAMKKFIAPKIAKFIESFV